MSNEQFDKQSKALREFFIFTYFKTKECKNNHNDLIQNIIKKSYNDATMMGAYNTLLNKELSEKIIFRLLQSNEIDNEKNLQRKSQSFNAGKF